MANTIRLKKRASGGASGAPSSLAPSEPAYSEVDNILYYGFGDAGGGAASSVIAIAGSGAYATLTGNQTISGNKTYTGTLDFSGATIATFETTGNVTVGGDLVVNGTTTTVNSTTVTVDDKNIELGSVATPTDTTADGGGITLKGATDKTFNWVNSTDSWTSSEHIDLASGKEFKIAGTSVLSGSTLGSGVTASSLTSVGTIATGVWNGTAIGYAYGGTGLTAAPSNGQLAIGNGSGYTLATLTAGSNITITEGSGSITIASTDTNTTYTAGKGMDLLNGTEFRADIKANGGLVFEGLGEEIAVDLGASSITGTLGVGDGGTGRSSVPTNGQLLIGNGIDYTVNTLTAGNNVTITNTAGAISIAATDTDTTYTAGDGLNLTNTEFSVDLAANGGLEISNTELQVDSTVVRTTGGTFTGDIQLNETNSTTVSTLKFSELTANGSQGVPNWIGFKAPNAITADVTWTLPAADGTTTQTLSTDGNGILYWQTPTAVALKGGGGDQVFIENDQEVTTDYPITTGKNAMSAGPITVSANVTIPPGSTWTIV